MVYLTPSIRTCTYSILESLFISSHSHKHTLVAFLSLAKPPCFDNSLIQYHIQKICPYNLVLLWKGIQPEAFDLSNLSSLQFDIFLKIFCSHGSWCYSCIDHREQEWRHWRVELYTCNFLNEGNWRCRESREYQSLSFCWCKEQINITFHPILVLSVYWSQLSWGVWAACERIRYVRWNRWDDTQCHRNPPQLQWFVELISLLLGCLREWWFQLLSQGRNAAYDGNGG